MFCDGTLENGLNDTAGIGGRKIRVAARWNKGVHKLRPWNTVVAVTRRLDPESSDMIWRYGRRINRLRRLTEPPFDHPATRPLPKRPAPCRTDQRDQSKTITPRPTPPLNIASQASLISSRR